MSTHAIDLSKLISPLVFRGNETWAYRDPAAVYHNGRFYLYFTLSEIDEDGGYYNRVAMTTSDDLINWTDPVDLTPRDRKLNYSSPGNIIRFNDSWILCLQSYPTPEKQTFGDESSRLFVMRSEDLMNWSDPELLRIKGGDVPVNEMGRMIDPYLLEDTEHPGKWWCFYKQNGVSMSHSMDLKSWTYAGRAAAGENVTVIRQGDEYVMFHSPQNGIGVKRSKMPDQWGKDEDLLTLGQKDWPWAQGRLTAATVLDLTQNANVGKYIMFFHGDSSEGLKKMPAHGAASLAVAWSDDLKNWDWPGRGSRQEIEIDGAFPGGNIVVEEICGDHVRLHQELRDTRGHWFYWCFRIRGAAGKTLHFEFTQSQAIGVLGPAVSFDHGRTWQWVGADSTQGNRFSYAFPIDALEVRFSVGMPYLETDWKRAVNAFANTAHFSVQTLCTTPKQRDVEYALLGCLDSEPAHRVVVTCRHHCCEMMASYSAEGLVQWVAQAPDSEAEWMRKNVQLLLVPFMDKDGVQAGDQGKNRQPHDHNRDYEGESIYASTAAIRDLLPQWSAGRLRLGLDLHCPCLVGSRTDTIYIVGSSNIVAAREQERLSQILDSVSKGKLPFLHANFLPSGQEWNIETNFTGGKTFTRWLETLSPPVPGLSFEIPYASASDVEVNQTSARLFGHDLGRALAGYLQEIDRKG